MSGVLHRYWIVFDGEGYEAKLGVGVTGFNHDDAMEIARTVVFDGRELPAVKRISEDVELTQLDAKHVLPNCYPAAFRGVWFPMIRMGIQ